MNFDLIPDNAILEISKYLDLKNLFSFSRINKKTYSITASVYYKKILEKFLTADEVFWEEQIKNKKKENENYSAHNIYLDFFNDNKVLILSTHKALQRLKKNQIESKILKYFLPNSIQKKKAQKKREFTIALLFTILKNGFEFFLKEFLKVSHIYRFIKYPQHHHEKDDIWQTMFKEMLEATISSRNPSCLIELLEHIHSWQSTNSKNLVYPTGFFISHIEVFEMINKIILDKNNLYPRACVNYLIKISTWEEWTPFDYDEQKKFFKMVLCPKTYEWICLCVNNNKHDIVKTFIENNNQPVSRKEEILDWCIAKALEEKKVIVFIFLIKYRSDKIPSLFQQAFEQNNYEIFSALLKEPSVNIYQHDEQQRTVLHRAIITEKNLEIIKLLSVQNHLLQAEDANGCIALDYAPPTKELIESLLKQSLFLINRRHPLNGKTLLHRAVIADKRETIKFLIELGADTKIKDHSQKTPLDYANNELILYIEDCKKNNSDSFQSSFSKTELFWSSKEVSKNNKEVEVSDNEELFPTSCNG